MKAVLLHIHVHVRMHMANVSAPTRLTSLRQGGQQVEAEFVVCLCA